MSENGLNSLEAYFGEMTDPRVAGRCEHKLVEILIIAVCGMLSGANSWHEIEEFGQTKEAWLRLFLELPGGIPSHDTFGRVFSLLDGAEFQTCFARWVEGVFAVKRGQVVAIDGKTARGSQDAYLGKRAIHLVSAWARDSGLLLGQRKVDDKSNEISAIPELLKDLYVAGCIVTIDAMGCQTEIARTIIDQHADYVLALKGNQGQLHQDVVEWFEYAQQVNFEGLSHTFDQSVDKQGGRIEIRRAWAMDDPLAFETLRHHEGWLGLRSIVMLQRERHWTDHLQTDTAYYISSLPAHADLLLDCTRAHWSVENTFHWTMDVIFAEDTARVRLGEAPENMAVLRHLALNLLRHDPSSGSLNRKRLRAALDDDFRLALLSQL